MCLKDGEMPESIGITITSEYDFKGEWECKIGSRWWNQGCSSEAAGAVIDYMFHNTDFERIDAYCPAENHASKKVMEKTGMHCEGLLRHYCKTRDGFHEGTLYGIKRNEGEEICLMQKGGIHGDSMHKPSNHRNHAFMG